MSLPLVVSDIARNLQPVIGFSVAPDEYPYSLCLGGQAALLIAKGQLALHIGNHALTALGKEPLPSGYGWAAFVIPPVLLMINSKLPSGYVKEAVRVVKNNLRILLRTAVIVSQVALVYFTGSVAAIAALSYLALDGLYSSELLPARISRVYSWMQFPLFLVSSVLSGTWISTALYTTVLAFIKIQQAVEGRIGSMSAEKKEEYMSALKTMVQGIGLQWDPDDREIFMTLGQPRHQSRDTNAAKPENDLNLTKENR